MANHHLHTQFESYSDRRSRVGGSPDRPTGKALFLSRGFIKSMLRCREEEIKVMGIRRINVSTCNDWIGAKN